MIWIETSQTATASCDFPGCTLEETYQGILGEGSPQESFRNSGWVELHPSGAMDDKQNLMICKLCYERIKNDQKDRENETH